MEQFPVYTWEVGLNLHLPKLRRGRECKGPAYATDVSSDTPFIFQIGKETAYIWSYCYRCFSQAMITNVCKLFWNLVRTCERFTAEFVPDETPNSILLVRHLNISVKIRFHILTSLHCVERIRSCRSTWRCYKTLYSLKLKRFQKEFNCIFISYPKPSKIFDEIDKDYER